MLRLFKVVDLDLLGKVPLRRFFIEKKGSVFSGPPIPLGVFLERPFIEGHKSEILTLVFYKAT